MITEKEFMEKYEEFINDTSDMYSVSIDKFMYMVSDFCEIMKHKTEKDCKYIELSNENYEQLIAIIRRGFIKHGSVFTYVINTEPKTIDGVIEELISIADGEGYISKDWFKGICNCGHGKDQHLFDKASVNPCIFGWCDCKDYEEVD